VENLERLCLSAAERPWIVAVKGDAVDAVDDGFGAGSKRSRRVAAHSVNELVRAAAAPPSCPLERRSALVTTSFKARVACDCKGEISN
jgi:hypothetical protein